MEKIIETERKIIVSKSEGKVEIIKLLVEKMEMN